MKVKKVKFEKEKDDHYIIGRVYRREGKLILVVGGSYMGGYDRVSNHFSWQKVKADGSLSEKILSGYGDCNIRPVKCKIETRVIL